MVVKKSYLGLLLGVLILIFITNVSAITGSIGNPKMGLTYLEPKIGDTFERYIPVENRNDVSVDIELSVSGDLGDGIELKETNFRLLPGEKKDAYFTIKVTKSGELESKINVKFTPTDGGNGVVLTSTIFMVAEKGPGFLDSLFDNSEETDSQNIENNSVQDNYNNNSNKLKIGLSITAIIFLIFIILLSIYGKNQRKILIKPIKNKNEK